MEFRRHHTQRVAAAKSGLSERTGRRIERDPRLPSQKAAEPPRRRQVADPFGGLWESDILPLLVSRPGLRPVTLLEGDAQALPAGETEFDTVVITLGLCTIPDPDTALREARRVLKPDGRLVFLEHVRSPRGFAARCQDLVTPLWVRMAGGCHPNRPTLDGIRGAGFEILQLEHDSIPHAPPFVRPLIVGSATA